MSIRCILLDVEGTTTSISFVHDTLFPFAKKKIAGWIKNNIGNKNVKQAIENVKETCRNEKIEFFDEHAIDVLINWIDSDRKHSSLKLLQGLIWKEGYIDGSLRGHVYPEVPHCLKKWREQGIELGIYSSGSVEAQKLLFSYSIAGDLNKYFSYNFDTAVGHKREVKSYQNIISSVNTKPNNILFLSDICEELDAAKKAGMKTIQLIRDEKINNHGPHSKVQEFTEIELTHL